MWEYFENPCYDTEIWTVRKMETLITIHVQSEVEATYLAKQLNGMEELEVENKRLREVLTRAFHFMSDWVNEGTSKTDYLALDQDIKDVLSKTKEINNYE